MTARTAVTDNVLYYIGIAMLTIGVGMFLASMFLVTGQWRRK